MKKIKKKKKNKYKLNKIYLISFILGMILTIITASFLSLLNMLNLIPDKYFIIILVIIVVITLIIDYFLFKKSKKKIFKYVKIFFIILSIIIISGYTFATYNLNKTMHFFDNISFIKEDITNYYVIVLKEKKYSEISDLYGLSLGYVSRTNQEVIDSLDLNLEYKKIEKHDILLEKLYNKEIEAILISDIIKNSYEEIDDDFEGKTKIIKKISIKNKIEDITKRVSIKNTPFNVLISGIDEYGEINSTSRNDVNIVATINPNTNKILLTSIPRDYYVQLHGTEGNKDKLTHASYYGTNVAVQTVEDILDIDINYYVKVNFTTVVDLVDALGGIEVYADQTVYLKSKCRKYVYKGYNTLDGKCALAFSRERKSYSDGDLHRGRNQQEVIKAIFNKASSSTKIITEYSNILALLEGKFATNMNMNDVTSLIKYELDDLSKYTIESTQLNGTGSIDKTYSYPGQDLWVMIPDQKTIESAKKKIDEIMAN